MKDPGWTLSDLDGELAAQGIDLDDLSYQDLHDVLYCPTPEKAAEEIAEQRT